MKKFSEWVMALLFSGTLLVLMAATILLPKERYSYYENRNLSAFPEISVESIANGKVFGELETMFCDYAAWRTAALRAVTWCDLNLFHRPVVNEVVVTPDALLEELYTMPDTAEDIVREADTVAADNAALRDQIEAYGGYYCYLAVPCQYAYYEDAYPAYLENRAAYTATERAALREAMEARGIAYVDMGEIFDAEGHLPEFSSKVDNHYGLRGAYVTYRAAAERLAADGCALRVPEEGTDVTFSALPNPYMGSRTRKLLGLRGSDEKLLTASFAEDIPFTRFDNGAAEEATVYALPGSDAEPLTYGLYTGGAIVLAGPIADLFVGYDAALHDMTVNALRIYSVSFLVFGFNIFGSAFFTGLNDGTDSALISFLRTLVFQVAAILLLPRWLDINGIWLAVTAAESLTLLVTVSLLAAKRRKYHY